MQDDDLFLNDGYTATKTVPAVPGLHPELRLTYRPALSRDRHAYRVKVGAADPAAVDACETDLIIRQRTTINGVEMRDKEKVARLRPAIRVHVLDAILGYSPEDEAQDAKNSSGGSGSSS